GVRELARKYLDHADGKVRAAAVSGLLPDDVRELLPRLTEMIGKEQDEDTFILLAKSLIRTNDPNATDVVIKAIEHLKEARDTLYLHFFNDMALFTPPDPVITRFMFTLVRGKSTIRDEGFSVFSRWVWSVKREPDPAFVRICIDEIKQGNLSTDPRRQPEAKSEQNECEQMLSFMNNGKNPIGDFEDRVRGKDAVAFAEKWLKEHGG
ncbi:MAG TPA: HEAT repeat domain-containing protein, partial [Pyrinomonadaceae bacterium]|nr:HEAT repeat domain-containing protein [Pyrinomonadaceae bacterium]